MTGVQTCALPIYVVSTDLTKILQAEFSADGCNVRTAAYNYDTKQMELDVDVIEDL